MMGIRFDGPPEPRPDPHARGLGRPSAPQGLPARRRAGALLGRGVAMAIVVRRRGSTRARASRSPCPRSSRSTPSSTRSTTSSRSTSGRTTPRRTACSGSSSTSTGRRSRASARSSATSTPGFEKNMEAKTWWKSVTYAPRIDYVSLPGERARLRARGREAARHRGPAHARPGRAWRSPSSTASTRTSSGSARRRSSSGRSRSSGTAFDDRDAAPRPLRDGRRDADAHALLPGRRARGGHPARLHRRGAEVLRRDAEVGRRVRGDPRPQRDLARADEGHRPALGRRRARARAVGPDAPRARA